uniref:Aegyptin/gSG7 salivary protein-like four-helix bundle domain-containing protein n=1 Tax=Anopheles melas TaxID=34690 RepID=A0A182TXV1_9DIPT
MKFLLLVASVLCLALIVSARPAEDTSDQESSTELSEDAGAEDAGSDAETDAGATDGEEGATDTESGGEGDDSEMDSAMKEGEEGAGSDDAVSGADDETEESKDDAEEGSEEGGEEGGDDESGGEGGEKESPRNTYRQVHKLLKKIMKVDTKDKYLKSFVVGRLQERLMNPTIDLVSTIEKYSKIKECFSSLDKDVSAMVKESEKSYEECSKDKTNTSCGTEGTRELDDGLIEREQELSDCIVDKRDAE